MHRFLLVTPHRESFSEMAATLAAHGGVDISWVPSGGRALKMLADVPFDLVVTDERLGDMTGLELAARLISINPRINCAAVSSLSAEDFHEASEGLGLMDALPLRPGRQQADNLLQRLIDLKKRMGRASVRKC